MVFALRDLAIFSNNFWFAKVYPCPELKRLKLAYLHYSLFGCFVLVVLLLVLRFLLAGFIGFRSFKDCCCKILLCFANIVLFGRYFFTLVKSFVCWVCFALCKYFDFLMWNNSQFACKNKSTYIHLLYQNTISIHLIRFSWLIAVK